MKEPMVPKAILFDLDGTIITSETIAEPAWWEACRIAAKANKKLDSRKLFNQINEVRESFWNDPVSNEEGRKDIRKARTWIVEEALSRIGVTDRTFAESIELKYSTRKDELTGFFPKAEAVLQRLRERNIKLILVTNGEKEMQREKINRFHLERYFVTCLIEGELGYGKPDPRVYQTALSSLAVSTNEAWMIGNDLQYDLSGSKELGIFSVWCDFEKKGLPSDSKVIPDKIIHDITELLPLIDDKHTSGRK
jgi:HAD superfamily hydrolase (TIGR01549 family)